MGRSGLNLCKCSPKSSPLRHAESSAGGIFTFTHAAQFALHVIGPLQQIMPAKPFDQPSKFYQVRQPE